MERSIQEHKRLLEACRKKDLRQIRETAKSHYGQAVEFLLKKLVPRPVPRQEHPEERNQGRSKIDLPHPKKKGARV
jgi:hypothetical protein